MDQESSVCLVDLDSTRHPKLTLSLRSSFSVHVHDIDDILATSDQHESIVVIFSRHSVHDVIDKVSQLRSKFHNSLMIVMGEFINPKIYAELLQIGVEDYLQMQNADELEFRLKVQKTKASRSEMEVVKIANLVIDPNSRAISSIDTKQTFYLSPIEISLLLTLIHAMGRSISRQEVKKACWGAKPVSDNALNRKLFEIRRVLAQLEARITVKTIYGSGFAIQKLDDT